MNLHGKRQGVLWALMILAGAVGIWVGSPSLAARQQESPKILRGAEAVAQLKRDGQKQTLQAAMQQAQLAVSLATQTPLGRAAWHAPNRSAGYDAYVTENGVSIALGNQAYVSLSLQKLGYGTALRTVAPGKVSGDQQTITLMRDGGVQEWYVNGPDGLEHGFTLSNPPGLRQQGVPLRMVMQISEGWRAAASEDGKAVTLRGSNDQAIEYSQLTVHDKTGRPVPARLAAGNEYVAIEVEDRNAEYPLTIDPLFTLQQRLLAADGQASEYFGYAVALSGNTAIVGAPYDENSRGSAYVFVRNGATWTQQARLLANDGVLNDYFGWSVALDGDTALIGSLYGPGSANADQGAAYVFVRNGTTWTQQQRLAASDGQLGAHFGTAVSLDNNTALIGAPDHQLQPGLTTGAAYVFVRTGTAWTQQKQLLALGGESGDQFGAAVAVDGDMALIGAPGDDIVIGGSPKLDQGTAYTFRRSGTDWIRGNPLDTRLNGGGAGDAFGNAVALSGNTALIGSYLGGSIDVGWVYVFKQIAPGAWNYETILFPSDNQIKHFGVSLALDGDMAVIGASLKLFEPGTDSRSAWVFAKVGNDWRQIRKFGPESGSSPGTVDDRFGATIALDDSTVLIGAYQSDASATDQGAVFAFALHDSQHVQSQKLVANDGTANDHFGKAMASSSDTLVISADEDDIGTNANQGSVYVFTRNGANWIFQQKLTANDGAAQDRFGNAVALDGDTLAVGAALDDTSTNTDQGAVYVFIRNGANWMFQQKLTAVGIDALPNDRFGASISVSGQTIAVGAPGVDLGRGAAYVFTRTGTTWVEQAKLFIGGNIPPISFGVAVALYGNGDRLLVGAPFDDNEQGAIYPYLRSGTAWLLRPKVTPFNQVPGAHFGSALGLAQDINQVFVGAPDETVETKTHQGAVYTYGSGAADLIASGYFTAIDGAAEDNFGSAIAIGNNIAIVGAPGDNIGAISDQGSAHVYNYLGGFWHWQRKLLASDGATADGFGSAVAVSGDAVIAGAPSDAVGTNAGQGSAYVFVSPACSALTIAPSSLPNGSVGTMYNQVFTTSGASVGDYQYTLTDGVMPPGLVFESFGILHGTPTAAGTYRFTIKSTFASNLCAASRSYTVTILPPCLGMALNPAILPDSTVGATYSQTMTATGEAPPYTFTISAGNLPMGLSLAANGALTGVPTAVGTYNFSVQAGNASGCTATQAYTVTIHQSGGGLQFYPLPHPVRLLDTRAGATGCDTPGAKIAGNTSRTQTAAGRTCDGLTIPANAAALVGNATSVQSGGGYFTLYPSDITKPNSANSNYAANQILNGLFTVRLGASDGAFKIFVSTDTDVVVDVTGYYAPPSATGLYFHPLPKPLRLLDTRAGASACFTPGAALQGNTDVSQIGTTTCDGVLIPAGALALTGNATTVSPQANGFLTLYPSNAARPLIASANFQPGVNLNSPFMVGLSPSGQFNIYVASTTDLVIDVTGYYSTQMNDSNGQGLLLKVLSGPTRLLDTRIGQTGCFTPNAQMTGGTAYLQAATGACTGIPATAQAVVGNATTLNAVANGYLTFWPSGANQPFIATSNYRTGITFNRHFTTGLGADGAFKRFALSTTDLMIDLCGYFAP